MVELALPKNSQITTGKIWPKPQGASKLTDFRIYRWNPDDGKNPSIDTYYVNREDCGPMVLDGLIYIKNKIDPTLTFARSCREGVCGSCAMNIGGTNTLACTKGMDEVLVKGVVNVYPLPHMPVVKDLVPDLTRFYAQHASIEPWLQTDTAAPEKEWRQSKEDREQLDGSMSASCAPAAPLLPELLVERRPLSRPAALLQANRWLKDSRDERTGDRLDNLEDPSASIAATPS